MATRRCAATLGSKTRFRSRAGIRPTTTWPVVSGSSRVATLGGTAARSRMGQSVDVGGGLLRLVRGDNANSGALRARNPWQSISVRCVGGWCLPFGGSSSLLASAWRTSRRCYFAKGELWLAGGRNAWVFRPTPRTRESSTRFPCCASCPPSRCQCGADHSAFGSPLGRDRRVMTIPAASSVAAEALAS